jgi:hypothetical protein
VDREHIGGTYGAHRQQAGRRISVNGVKVKWGQ